MAIGSQWGKIGCDIYLDMQSVWYPNQYRIFMKMFDIKPVKDGLGWHKFQKKTEAENFIVKLPQSIKGWKIG